MLAHGLHSVVVGLMHPYYASVLTIIEKQEEEKEIEKVTKEEKGMMRKENTLLVILNFT